MNILYAFAHHMRIIFAHAHVRILCARTLRLRSCRLKARRLRSCSHTYIGGRRKLPQAEEVRRPLGGARRVVARWVRPKVYYGRFIVCFTCIRVGAGVCWDSLWGPHMRL